MDIDLIVGKNVKRLRRRNGYSQETFSELLGISCMTVGRIEKGQTSMKVQLLGRMSEALSIPERDILSGGFPERKCCIYEQQSKNEDGSG